MIRVNVSRNSDGDIEIRYSGNKYNFLIGSIANYTPGVKTLILENQDGNTYKFEESRFEFYIFNVLWAFGFDTLCDEFNKNLFISSSVSPPPVAPVEIFNAPIVSGYQYTSAIQAIGRKQVHLDFIIGDNGSTLADPGCIIALVQVSDDNINWLNINNLAPGNALVADPQVFEAGTVFLQSNAVYAPIAIPYDDQNLPSLPIRISISTGYGEYYRLALRASDPAGISALEPTTFPDLLVHATLQ